MINVVNVVTLMMTGKLGLYHTDPIVLYFKHYLRMKVVLYLEHYLFVMKTGKVETQSSKDGGVIIGTLLVCDEDRKS